MVRRGRKPKLPEGAVVGQYVSIKTPKGDIRALANYPATRDARERVKVLEYRRNARLKRVEKKRIAEAKKVAPAKECAEEKIAIAKFREKCEAMAKEWGRRDRLDMLDIKRIMRYARGKATIPEAEMRAIENELIGKHLPKRESRGEKARARAWRDARKLSQEELDRAVDAYRSSNNLKDAASKLGVSPAKVSARLRNAGVKTRQGKNAEGYGRVWSISDLEAKEKDALLRYIKGIKEIPGISEGQRTEELQKAGWYGMEGVFPKDVAPNKRRRVRARPKKSG